LRRTTSTAQSARLLAEERIVVCEGQALVTCTVRDRAGNSASSSFTVVVRAPTTAGAVFKRGGKTKRRAPRPG
jgi:hypothetical protein